MWDTIPRWPAVDIYSIGLVNSRAIRKTSPASCWRVTLHWIGDIPAGTRAEEESEGAGIVIVRSDPGVRDRGHAIRAPVPLISIVFASSRNGSPCESRARMKSGIWSLSRSERLARCASGRSATGSGRMFSLGICLVSVLTKAIRMQLDQIFIRFIRFLINNL
jgi:hypothetical protein